MAKRKTLEGVQPSDEWVIIPDHRVRHIWLDLDTREEIEIDPDWYASNGTPISAETGVDCEYLRTEVRL